MDPGQDPYNRIIEKLTELVNTGALRPNQKVYSEHQLAQLLKIPRAQVREVYSTLRILGILYGRQGQGTYFKASEAHQNTELLYLMMMMENSRIEDIISMRTVLETGAAGYAALNRSDDDLKEMQACVDIMERTGKAAILAEQDARFHRIITSATGNPLLVMLQNIVYGYISRIADAHWKLISSERLLEERRQFFAQHRAILDAIRAKDSEQAVIAMRRHMRALTENMRANQAILKQSTKLSQHPHGNENEDVSENEVKKKEEL